MIRKAVGMDDDAFENEDDPEGGKGKGKKKRIIISICTIIFAWNLAE